MIPVKIVATNPKSQATINLTPEDHSMVTEFTGEQPLKANLSSQALYNRDGALFQSSRGNTRNLVFSVYIFRNVTETKHQIYDVFSTGDYCDLSFTTSGKIRFISGIVESVEYNRYVEPDRSKQVIQISMICFEPYFEGETHTLTDTASSIDINYEGTEGTGLIIEIPLEGVSFDGTPLLRGAVFEISDGTNELRFSQRLSSGNTSPYKLLTINSVKKVVTMIGSDDTEINFYKALDQKDDRKISWPILNAEQSTTITVKVYKGGSNYQWQEITGIVKTIRYTDHYSTL